MRTGRAFSEAHRELLAIIGGVEGDFRDRVLRLLSQQMLKFRQIVVYPAAAEGAHQAERPRLESTELMEFLLTAAREQNYDWLAVVEHRALLPGLGGINNEPSPNDNSEAA